MPPQLALFICILFISYLYIGDVRKQQGISHALWIPLIWLLITGSRSVSEWVGANVHYESVNQYEEGSPLDRNISSILIAFGVFILFKRKISWARIVRLNSWLFVFVMYCGISIAWSEFPLVALKRWVRAIGVIVMVLIVVTDHSPDEAVRALIRRWMYASVPLSVVVIKYFDSIGRSYDRWTGQVYYSGIGADKNALGYLCAISGFFCAWSLLLMWKQKVLLKEKKEAFLILCFVGMIAWLLELAQSATSLGVLFAGICFLAVLNLRPVTKHLNLSILGTAVTFFILFGIVDVVGLVLNVLNRNVTLTGRTEVWKDLMEIEMNPLIGAGYDSFWLGSGAEQLWAKYWWHPVQAHNGYLETYINVGLIGLCLLFGVIVAAYLNAKKSLGLGSNYAKFQIAFIGMILLYNITEAGFKTLHPMWFVFLLLAMKWPRTAEMKFKSVQPISPRKQPCENG